MPLDGRLHEAFSVVVARGDDLWFKLVSHVIWGLLDAELKGRDSRSKPDSFRRDVWRSLGSDPQSGTRMIRKIGHYGEICGIFPYTRHVQLSFSRGDRFDDPAGPLDGTGKYRRHMNVAVAADIPEGA